MMKAHADHAGLTAVPRHVESVLKLKVIPLLAATLQVIAHTTTFANGPGAARTMGGVTVVGPARSPAWRT